MQSLKPISIVIQGSYWDSQIYSGELMLLTDRGSLERINWGAAVDEIAGQHQQLQSAIRATFSDSDWLYNPQTKRLLDDPSFGDLMKRQLLELSRLPARQMDAHRQSKYWTYEDSPFRSLPTDTDVYNRKIYAASEEGLYSAPHKGQRLWEKLDKHHDASFLQVKASDGYKAVAAAAGKDGLFEFSIRDDEGRLDRAKLLNKRPCSACEWAFQSVVGWGNSDAFFASFNEEKEKSSSKIYRTPSTVFEFSSLFEILRNTSGLVVQSQVEHSFSWGSREKLYRATNEGIEVTDYFGHGWVKNPEHKLSREAISKQPFIWRGLIPFEINPQNIIATGTAPFGAVIEEENRLTVIKSDGQTHIFEGELVHWRVFPRSTHYSNQLHLIYEDRLEIVSFVHDYFENQKEKLAGFAR